MRIVCLNNYSMEKMLDLSRQGLIPGQHGWGIQQLCQAQHDVLVAPFLPGNGNALLERASRATRHVFGQLDQELWAIRQRPDVLYAADQHSLAGVAMTRRMLMRGRRMVSIVHHPIRGRGARLRAAAIRAHDAVVTLNQAVCQELATGGIDARFLPWGPDLESPLYEDSHDDGFAISTGKSNRDIATLVKALTTTGQEGLVYDLGRTVTQAPGNVTLVHPGGAGTDPETGGSYLAQPVLDQTRAAGFVAIPIADPERLTGLTEINDALALGKPIVITKSRYTPIDVEAIGCGIAVGVGDVDGWVSAIQTLRDPATRHQMGALGRQFAQRSWNYATFGEELVKMVEEVKAR
jgi:hypothetical protein